MFVEQNRGCKGTEKTADTITEMNMEGIGERNRKKNCWIQDLWG